MAGSGGAVAYAGPGQAVREGRDRQSPEAVTPRPVGLDERTVHFPHRGMISPPPSKRSAEPSKPRPGMPGVRGSSVSEIASKLQARDFEPAGTRRRLPERGRAE